jgi:hypothetical protein
LKTVFKFDVFELLDTTAVVNFRNPRFNNRKSLKLLQSNF